MTMAHLTKSLGSPDDPKAMSQFTTPLDSSDEAKAMAHRRCLKAHLVHLNVIGLTWSIKGNDSYCLMLTYLRAAGWPDMSGPLYYLLYNLKNKKYFPRLQTIPVLQMVNSQNEVSPKSKLIR
jgi:hypothetical protein